MSQRPARPLNYASPGAATGGLLHFRAVVLGMGLCGVMANLAFIVLAVSTVGRAQGAYRNLQRDPRHYGREVSAATIATLRRPVRLWTAASVFSATSALGLLLAVRLSSAAAELDRHALKARRRLEGYARWKPAAAVATTLAFVWLAVEDQVFWTTATRHRSVGSGPPVVSTAVLLACALLPLLWVRAGVRQSGPRDGEAWQE